MKKLFTALAFLFLLSNPAYAQYVRVTCASLTPAATFRGTCFDYTSFSLNYWSGSAWIPITGGGGGSGTVTSVATSNGVTGGTITTSGTISGVNAAADGSTKGVASFTANDFNATSGNISLDYTNGQKASASVPGFLSSTDWSTFNGKQASGNYITALTGDVTASGPGSVASTIANSAVTLAKIQNAAASSKLLGSGATGSGSPYAEITLGTNLSMSGTTLNAAGGGGTGCTTSGTSILQGDGLGGCSNVTVGSGLDFTGGTLTSTGAAPDTAHYVTTQAESGLSAEFNLGGLTTGLLKHSVSAGVSTPATATADTDYASAFTRTGHGDSDYTIQATDRVVAETASLTAPRTFTLPAASAYPASRPLIIVDEAGGVTSTNTLTIARAGSDTINGATSIVIKAANGGVVLESDGTSKWTMVANTLTAAQACATHQFFNGFNADGTFSCAQPAFTDVSGTAAVAQGGTGLTSGTSGGVLAYTASGTLASSGALTANLPVIGGGAGAAPSVGTRSGNTTAFVTTTGTQTSGDCVKIDANGNHIAAGSPCGSGGGTVVFNSPGLRLTLTTGVPVTTSDVTAAGTLYYTPMISCHLVVVISSALADACITEISLSLTLTSGKNYDAFVSCTNSTTCALALSSAWTDDTTRADALATESLCGCQVLSSDHTKLWIGTLRASGTNTTEDSAVKRFLWNAYNQVQRHLLRIDTTDRWDDTTNSWRQANSSTANQLAYVNGRIGNAFSVSLEVNVIPVTAIGAQIAIGEDATTPSLNSPIKYFAGGGANEILPVSATMRVLPTLGYHYFTWLEHGPPSGTATFLGYDGNGATSVYRSEINGETMM